MRNKIEKLLAEKILEREELNKTYTTEEYCFIQEYSEIVDTLEIEIDLLEKLLKDE